ncbi:CidA/LrgA family protein [Rubellimicrobium arenae]|uniref:CidA/LrgA family protein n=1 Tax=Rubellimicrobium arenae TaxID=2817372 RepID=UPI001B3049E3|nr:CidA/LrgA family protein [Rubellimicrobium arenae]
MIRGIAALLLFQLLGESLVFLTGLRVPGPVVGLVLLFLALQASRRWAPEAGLPVERVADGLLSHLGLLFVPAGVGVVALGAMVDGQGAAIAVVLVLSAILTLAATVWAFLLTRRWMGREDPP